MGDPFRKTTAAWPVAARIRFDDIRAVILRAAAQMDAGPIEECLKWGQPAWRPRRPRQGSTLRADWSARSPETLALFVDCKTTLSATMRDIYPTEFTYVSNRALHLPLADDLPEAAVDHLVRLTFGYHRRSR